MDLIKSINQLCKHIEKSTNCINRGGCAVFAAHMGEALEPYGDVKIAVLSDCDDVSIDDARNNIENNTLTEWNDKGVHFTHIVVEFTHNKVKYFIDAEFGAMKRKDFIQRSEWPLMEGRLSIAEAKEIAAEEVGWNKRFNRKQIPKIKRMIKAGFRMIEDTGFFEVKGFFSKLTS